MSISRRCVRWVVIAIAVVVAMMLASAAAQADIINVPGDYPTIQQAIDAAVDGDEIVVAPGTYDETINFLGKAITVRSSDGPEVTIIDAQQTGTVVTCHSGEGPETVLEGFMITGGFVGPGLGGGMSNANSSPTVTNCSFSGNTASGFEVGGSGGGMFNSYSSPTVTNCTFSGNSATYGGGMSNSNSSPIVIECTFSENAVAGFSPRGGGMYNFESNPTVTNCTFIGNTALGLNTQGFGGGMYNSGGSSTVTNCTFTDNSAELVGGGMSDEGGSSTVTNCTFSGNSAAYGGGMISFFGGSLTVTNCVLWKNSKPQIDAATVDYSDIQGGYEGRGNIDIDPMFVDPINGDLRLMAGSPCIDAADNTVVPKGIVTDLDGNARFIDDLGTPDTGNADCINPIVDMGAYEFLPFPSPPGDLNGDGVVGIIDLLMLLASWGDCPGLPEQCSADLNYDCVVGIGDLLTMLANWG